MITKETIREIIAIAGAEKASGIVRCGECPYENECKGIDAPTCTLTLKECNFNYIKELNKPQGENEMTTMLPDNTIQINPQGEVEGLDSLSLENLAKLSTAARDLLERKNDEIEQQLWDKVVNAVKEYCDNFGNVDFVFESSDDGEEHCISFSHKQMNECRRGEINYYH